MTSTVGLKRTGPLRCPACQLQLCKSRNEPPHGALKATDVNGGPAEKFNGAHDTPYLCQRCAAVLLRSNDLSEVGWRHLR